MIVDVHTHLWQTPEQLGESAVAHLRDRVLEPWDRRDAGPTAHDYAMEPVDYAFILGLESKHLGASISHEQVAGYVARHPGKYLGFAGIDPMDADWPISLARAVELGLAGVTISPAAAAFHPVHTSAIKLYEKCESLGLPVMVHPGTHLGPQTVMHFSQPYLFDEVACAFPNLRIILGQVGLPWTDQTLVMLEKHKNVFADLTTVVTRPWQLYNVLWLAHQQNAVGQLLFGSDFPFCSPEQAIVDMYSVNRFTHGTGLPSIPREQLRSIIERDTLSYLGLNVANSNRCGDETAPNSSATPISGV